MTPARVALIRFGLASLLAPIFVAVGIVLLGHATIPAPRLRIGYLSPIPPGTQLTSFVHGLRSLGYKEGEDLVIDYRYSHGDGDTLDTMAVDLVRSGVRLIVAQNAGAMAAKRATSTIPIVFVSLSDPLALGLVESLARPGGNVTGLANMPADLNLKRLEILKDAMPELRHVAIVVRSGNPNSQLHLAEEVAAAARFGLAALVYQIAEPDDYEKIFATIAADGMQAVLLVQDGVFFQTRKRMMDVAIRHHVPVIADALEYAETDALMAYGMTSRAGLHERVAVYVDKILKGANPAELPVDLPMDLGLAINLRVSRELGIPIPRRLLLRADTVIE